VRNLKLLIIVIFLFSGIYSASALLVGGLNYVNINSSFYYDNSTPFVNITEPLNGSTQTSLSLTLKTDIYDNRSITVLGCYFWVTDNNKILKVPMASFDCVSDSFVVSADGSYIVFVNVSDNVYLVETNSSFTVSTTSTPGQLPGGGGGSTTSISNATPIIDFGISSLTFTIIAPPSEESKQLLIKNVGKADLIKGTLDLSSPLQKYLSIEFCDVNKLFCGQEVNLKSGESGFLTVSGKFPKGFLPSEGFIKIVDEETYELPTAIDKVPLWFIIDPMVDFFMGLGLTKTVAVTLTFLVLLIILFLIITSLTEGGIFK